MDSKRKAATLSDDTKKKRRTSSLAELKKKQQERRASLPPSASQPEPIPTTAQNSLLFSQGSSFRRYSSFSPTSTVSPSELTPLQQQPPPPAPTVQHAPPLSSNYTRTASTDSSRPFAVTTTSTSLRSIIEKPSRNPFSLLDTLSNPGEAIGGKVAEEESISLHEPFVMFRKNASKGGSIAVAAEVDVEMLPSKPVAARPFERSFSCPVGGLLSNPKPPLHAPVPSEARAFAEISEEKDKLEAQIASLSQEASTIAEPSSILSFLSRPSIDSSNHDFHQFDSLQRGKYAFSAREGAAVD
ncbi:hypothetical protein SmJEL517_g00844 [Synchytrium microbalum]|uniref:Uncharacterized protein n=1 Tax=Synchytrium microbalum TaxID=1806994 RepID=A0A507CCH8_9FUNG|nr:uncharacterized protein SmJEL517_g00844 [Synchytrium microbalum]TPX37048.1 hypothetical protein SmJEL517_g00844 [Synchytrium microbalum]